MYQSREDRLRDLERERELYLSDPLFRNNDTAYYPSSSQLLSETNRIPPVDTSDYEYSRDFSNHSSALKGQIRQTKNGKHAFVEMSNLAASTQNSLSRSLVESELSRLQIDKKEREDLEKKQFSKASKSEKQRSKFQVSERARIDEEKARYAHLENAYHKMLSQVQKLQTTHLSDLRNCENRFNAASNTMQQALVSKSDELVSSTNKLVGLQARFERESRAWEKEKTSMIGQIEQLDKDFRFLETKVREQEKQIRNGNKLQEDLAERVAIREKDLVKYGKALHDRDELIKHEKEQRLKGEVRIIKTEEMLTNTHNELQEVKNMLKRRNEEAVEYEKLKAQFNESRREIEDFMRKEKSLLAEIEDLTNRERKLYADSEELASQHRKYVAEVSKLSSRQTGLAQEVEMMKTVEQNLRRELADSAKRFEAQNRELVDIQNVFRQSQNEKEHYARDSADLQSALVEVRESNQSLQKENGQYRISNESLMNNHKLLQAQFEQAALSLETKNSELIQLKKQISETSNQLEAEINLKTEIRNQNKEKLLGVSHKINELQANLVKTQQQLEDLQQNEGNLRQLIRQREDTVRSQNLLIAELQNNQSSLQSQLGLTLQELDNVKNKRRDEAVNLQEKFGSSKAILEQEVNNVRAQLAQKQAQLSSVIEECSHLKHEMNELSSERFNFESRISELVSSEASYQRQLAALQSSLNQKNQEITRSQSKYEQMDENLRRLEEELKNSKNGTADLDVSRTQSNIQELSKRVKKQVEALMETEDKKTNAPLWNIHARSPSPNAIMSSISPKRTSTNVPPRQFDETKNQILEDFEEVEKLLGAAGK